MTNGKVNRMHSSPHVKIDVKYCSKRFVDNSEGVDSQAGTGSVRVCQWCRASMLPSLGVCEARRSRKFFVGVSNGIYE